MPIDDILVSSTGCLHNRSWQTNRSSGARRSTRRSSRSIVRGRRNGSPRLFEERKTILHLRHQCQRSHSMHVSQNDSVALLQHRSLLRSVLGSSLYTCTDTTFTHYVESKEMDTVSFAAKLNDIVILPLPIQAMPVIACQDRLLRPLNVGRDDRSTALIASLLEIIGVVRSRTPRHSHNARPLE